MLEGHHMATSTMITVDSAAANTLAAVVRYGMQFAPDERVVQTASFRFSIAHFFLASHVALTTRHLVGDRPNAVCGLLTMGSDPFSSALITLASAQTRTSIKIVPLLVGLATAVLGMSNPATAWLGLVVGAFFCLAALQAVLRVSNQDGTSLDIVMSILERTKAKRFTSQITAAIATAHAPGPQLLLAAGGAA
jgi:hypothetical protein